MNSNAPVHDRRDFFKTGLGLAGAAVLASSGFGLAGCEETTLKTPVNPTLDGAVRSGGTLQIDLRHAANAGLLVPGGFRSFSFEDPYRIIVFRVSASEVSALSRVCAHQGCDLAPDGKDQSTVVNNELICGCHGSTYRVADGTLVKGPALTGVRTFAATLSTDEIVVTLA